MLRWDWRNQVLEPNVRLTHGGQKRETNSYLLVREKDLLHLTTFRVQLLGHWDSVMIQVNSNEVCDNKHLLDFPFLLISLQHRWNRDVNVCAGLQVDVAKFFIFFLTLFLTTMTASAICFTISASVRVFAIANLFCILVFIMSMVRT
jgi:hypothetical protein